jgi:hypothetical protein
MGMSILRVAAAAAAAAFLIAGCGDTIPTPDPSSPSSPTAPSSSATASPTPSPSSAEVSPRAPASDAPFVLRASVTQALGPEATFTWLPLVVITRDLRVLAPAPVPAIAPGPLLASIGERSLDADGWTEILADIRAAGLLDLEALEPGPDVVIDVGDGAGLVGGQRARLEVVADGVRYEITGDPSRFERCGATFCRAADPGTPEAFAQVWARVTDLEGWLGASLGPTGSFEPDAYAILTGPPPTDEPMAAAAPERWPLSTPIVTLGAPLRGDVTRRCGIVSGADATTLRPALEAATLATVWTDPTVVGSRIGLTVRPMLPGDDDACRALTG